MAKFPYRKIAYELTSDLDSRTQDIVSKRFGFGIAEPFTLERIGESHHITRERVRQIVDGVLAHLKGRVREKRVKTVLFDVFNHFSDILKKTGHLKREDLLLELLGDRESFAYIVFLLHLGDQFLKHKGNNHIHRFWTIQKDIIEKVSAFLEELVEYFERKKDAIALQEIEEEYGEKVPSSLVSFLEISKHVVPTHDGKWGLRHWPFVYPKTIRDKAYLVFKSSNKPLHFREVATEIDFLQRKLPGLKIKRILPQTVHNELIKDNRFVLVGRGTYALSNWGYKEGTVKDIVKSILEENGGKLKKEEVVKKALQQRQVKESTILLNLQDKKLFARDELGRYYIKEN